MLVYPLCGQTARARTAETGPLDKHGSLRDINMGRARFASQRIVYEIDYGRMHGRTQIKKSCKDPVCLLADHMTYSLHRPTAMLGRVTKIRTAALAFLTHIEEHGSVERWVREKQWEMNDPQVLAVRHNERWYIEINLRGRV